MGEDSTSQGPDKATTESMATDANTTGYNQLHNLRLLLLLAVSSLAGIGLSFLWDELYGPVLVGIVTCVVAHVWIIPLESHSQGLLQPQKVPGSTAPAPASTPRASTTDSSKASANGVSEPPKPAPPAAAAPSADPTSTGKYLDAQGVSPGARAMAAAMKAKATRAAKAQAAASNNLVHAAPSSTGSKAAGEGDRRRLVVLYGSQTGNAAEIAKQISAEAEQRKIPSAGAFPMNEFPMDKLQGVGVAVLVVSSTGDGDPPENCDRMVGSIQRKTWPTDSLQHLQYTVCGLGDSNYTRFMHIPRVFTRRLPELGARCFYKCCEADEVDGLEDIVEKWTGDLWEPLTKALQSAASAPTPTPLAAVAPGEGDQERLVGVAPLQPCKVRLLWQDTPLPTLTEEESPKEGAGEGALYTHSSPFKAQVKQAVRLSSATSDRNVVHMDVSLTGWEMPLPGAGDSVGVVPCNSPVLVEALLQRLAADPDHEFIIQSTAADGGRALSHIPSPCSLRRALSHFVDVTGVAKKGLLRVLAEYTYDKKEKHMLMLLSSRGGKEKYKEFVVECRPGLLELLQIFPSCKPDLAHLLEALPPLTTRFYSLCCSPAVASREGSSDPVLSFAFSVVRQKLGAAPTWLAPILKEGAGKERVFEGVCTTWMEEKLKENHLLWSSPAPKTPALATSSSDSLSLSIYPRSGGSFCHPADVSAPIIMIGPGTGVAPFRGFLEEREAALREEASGGSAGESWLFFGCRQKEEDYLYQEDLEGFVERGVLSRLVVAFSRAPENKGSKVYVQHKMEEHSDDLGRLLFVPNTHVFVCGDGAEMAKGVHAALLKVLQKKAGFRESDAIAHMANMLNQGRYIRDVWS